MVIYDPLGGRGNIEGQQGKRRKSYPIIGKAYQKVAYGFSTCSLPKSHRPVISSIYHHSGYSFDSAFSG
jgi:hypothetical protein